MWSRLFGLVLIVVSVAVLGGQPQLASDIHPESLSRLPPVQRGGLDANGQRVYDVIAGGRAMGRTGPAAISLYSPGAAEPIHHLNQYPAQDRRGQPYLRAVGAARGARVRSAIRMVRPRGSGVSAGVGQAVIDAVKYNRDVAGLPEKDAIVIRLRVRCFAITR